MQKPWFVFFFFHFGESNTHHWHIGSQFSHPLSWRALWVTKIKSHGPLGESGSNVKDLEGIGVLLPRSVAQTNIYWVSGFTWLPWGQYWSRLNQKARVDRPRRDRNSWPMWRYVLLLCKHLGMTNTAQTLRLWCWPCPLPSGTGHFCLDGIMCPQPW